MRTSVRYVVSLCSSVSSSGSVMTFPWHACFCTPFSDLLFFVEHTPIVLLYLPLSVCSLSASPRRGACRLGHRWSPSAWSISWALCQELRKGRPLARKLYRERGQRASSLWAATQRMLMSETNFCPVGKIQYVGDACLLTVQWDLPGPLYKKAKTSQTRWMAHPPGPRREYG